MPRYHFHIHDERPDPDKAGYELPNLRSARVEALRLAGEMIREAADRRGMGKEWRLDVTDGDGLMLLRMDFMVSESPAAMGASPSS